MHLTPGSVDVAIMLSAMARKKESPGAPARTVREDAPRTLRLAQGGGLGPGFLPAQE